MSPFSTTRVRLIAAQVFVAALLFYVGTTGGSLTSTDTVVSFELTRSLAERHSIALPENLLGLETNRGVDGRYYSQFGIGQSVYNLPFYLAGRTAQRLAGLHIGKEDSLPKAAVSLGSAVAASGTVATVFMLAWLISRRARASLIAAVACGAGSLLWPYAGMGFNAPLAAWILAAATACLFAGVCQSRPRLLAVAGAIVGVSVLTRHEFALIAVPYIIWLAIVSRGESLLLRRRLTLFLPGVIVGMAAAALYNSTRFGRPWIVGYSPWYGMDGYLGLLISPAGSVFLYSPTVVLGLVGLGVIARTEQENASPTATTWLLGAPVLCLFLLYGALDDWSGGRSYGPRYLVPLLPLLSVPIAPLFALATRRTRGAIIATIVLGALLQIPGVVVDYSRVSETWSQTASHDDLVHRRYRWSAAPVLLDSKAMIEAIPRTTAFLTGREQRPHIETTMAASRHDFAQQFAFSLDLWWLYLFYLGVVPATLACSIALVLLAAPIIVLTRAWKTAAQIDAAVALHRQAAAVSWPVSKTTR